MSRPAGIFSDTARRALALFSSALALALVATVVARAGAPEVRETWYETSIAGQRVGVTSECIGADGDSLLVTRCVSTIVVERLGDRVEMTQEDVWVETVAGRPLSYRAIRRMSSDEETFLDVDVGPGRLSVVKTSGRREDRSSLSLDGPILFPRGTDRLHARRGFEPGDEYSYRTFDPDFEAVSVCAVRVVGPDTLMLAGEERSLHMVEVRPDVYGGVVLLEWRDDAGAVWAQETPELGMVSRRTTEQLARRDARPLDLMSGMMIETNTSIPDPGLVDDALYEVWLDGGDPKELLSDAPRQVIEGRTQRGVLLRVRRIAPDPDALDGPVPVNVPDEYLEGNALLQKDDPAVERAARDAVLGAGDDPWLRSVKIESSVRGLVSDRGFGTAFASAAEVLRTGSGDCSEHAVLAAAMARAVGIPSRLVAGVVHFRRGFAYHMWLEVRSGDGWYALDPTQGRGSVDATHIRLGASSLSGGSIGELSLAVLRSANRLGIRVVEYTASGTTTRVQ